MQKNCVGEQMSLFAQDTEFLKMFQDCSQVMPEKTSAVSSRKQQGSSKRMPIFLDLRKGGGHMQEASSWSMGALHGRYTIVSGGAFLNEGNEFVYSLTSTDGPQQTCYLLLNTGEQPREPNPTLLSEVLVENADPKYNLSVRACQGILNRANRRGKKLPEILQKALESQAESNA